MAVARGQAPSHSGDPVVFGTSGTYPRAIRLADDSLLGIYTENSGSNHTLITVHSDDNGQSWEPWGQVDTREAATSDLDNGYVHQLPTGEVLATFRNHDKSGNDWTYYRITVCISTDGGASWTYHSTADERAATPGTANGLWEPYLQNALDGSLQLYYSRENAGDDQDSLLRVSTNRGVDWTDPETISGEDVVARDGMLGVARTGPNSQEKLAVFESGVNGLFTVHTVRSPDDGASWPVDSRQLVYSAGSSSAGAPQIIRVGGRLVASFGTNEDGGVWPQGAMKVVVSSNGGQSWADKTTIHDNPAMWSGLLELDDNSFLALYESGNTAYAQKMVFA
jgi:photosystem II stability/assembly factor-like uncharacterized protein